MTEKTMKMPPAGIKEKRKSIWTIPQIILGFFIFLFSLVCLLPFVNVLALSLSSKSAILRGAVSFWPVEFETTAYQVIFNDASMLRSLVVTIIITVVYTLFSMILITSANFVTKRLGEEGIW